MRRPMLLGAALFGAGAVLSDGEGCVAEAGWLVGLVGLVLLLAWRAGPSRLATMGVAAAAIGLGSAAATVEVLQFEGNELRRFLAGEGTRDSSDLPLRLVGTLRGDAMPSAGRLLFQLDVESAERQARTARVHGRVRIEVGGDGSKPALVDGERVALWATLRPNRSSSAAGDGIVASGYCKSSRLLERRDRGNAGAVRRAAAFVRGRLRGSLVRNLPPGPERGLVLAMVIGDRSEIDDATAEAFRASGTYHVLALSGAQVALVAGLLVALLRLWLVTPWVQALVVTSSVSFYALLVGGDVPVVRAVLMAAALLVGRALEVDADASNLLGVAALGLLAFRPSSVCDVGFQLSFGATLGILVLVGPLTRGVPRLPLRAELAIAASVAAQSALGPVLAAAFHRLAPAALVLNLLAVPLSSAVLLLGASVAAADAFFAPAARLLGDIAWAAARALRASGDLGPLAPALDVRVAAPSLAVLALGACGLVRLARGLRAQGLALIAASQAFLVLSPLQPVVDGRLHLTVIDVGQGDSLLLQSPSGRALLIDAGGSRDPRFDPGERRVAPELWKRGVGRLDAVLVTHAHPDHVGGVPFVLRAFRTAEMWEGPAALADPIWRRAIEAIAGRRLARRTLAAGMHLDWDGVSIRVLGPVPPSRPPLRVRNEDSVVIDVATGGVHLLLTGDVCGEAEVALRLSPALVVKVPHHGSRSSSGRAFLAATAPRLALVSAGAHNPFGHPHAEVMERYRQAGALVLRTDRDGTIDVATDGARAWVRVAAEGIERRIR